MSAVCNFKADDAETRSANARTDATLAGKQVEKDLPAGVQGTAHGTFENGLEAAAYDGVTHAAAQRGRLNSGGILSTAQRLATLAD